MGPQRFGVPKTQYVCNFFFDIALTMGPQRFFFEPIGYTDCDGTHWFCLVLRGSRWFGLVWGWELTSLSRLSHDDGTFTRGKLPQIIYSILFKRSAHSASLILEA